MTKLHSSQYRNPGQLGEGAALVIGTAQSGTQIAAELAESGKRVYTCVGASAMRVPRRVRGRDFTWWLAKTGLYDTCIEELPEHKQREKRFGPNPSSAPARDVRLRMLPGSGRGHAHAHGDSDTHANAEWRHSSLAQTTACLRARVIHMSTVCVCVCVVCVCTCVR